MASGGLDGRKINLTFLDFRLGCVNDYMEISYESFSQNYCGCVDDGWGNVNKYCDNISSPNGSFVSCNINITHHADGSHYRGAHGFRAVWTELEIGEIILII